jgi:hypothetical protein
MCRVDPCSFHSPSERAKKARAIRQFDRCRGRACLSEIIFIHTHYHDADIYSDATPHNAFYPILRQVILLMIFTSSVAAPFAKCNKQAPCTAGLPSRIKQRMYRAAIKTAGSTTPAVRLPHRHNSTLESLSRQMSNIMAASALYQSVARLPLIPVRRNVRVQLRRRWQMLWP